MDGSHKKHDQKPKSRNPYRDVVTLDFGFAQVEYDGEWHCSDRPLLLSLNALDPPERGYRAAFEACEHFYKNNLLRMAKTSFQPATPKGPTRRLGAREKETLIRECIRQDNGPEAIHIRVRRISWRGPCTPKSRWVLAAKVPTDSSQAVVDRAIRSVLADERYFFSCVECGK